MFLKRAPQQELMDVTSQFHIMLKLILSIAAVTNTF